MEKPHTEKLIELLKIHPEGLTYDELCSNLNRKKKDIQNTLQLIKQRTCNVIKLGDKYILSDGTTPQRMDSIRKSDIVLDILLKNPDGVTPTEIAEQCDSTIPIIASRIHFLRTKGNDIPFIEGKYVYKGETNLPVNSKSVPLTTKLMSAKHRDAFKMLSEVDKTDCIDMLKKSLYYYKSAIALIESNSEVVSFLSSLEGSF